MDPERLTPYLRRRVLNLSKVDRLALQREIMASIREECRSNPVTRMEVLARKMEDVSGVDLLHVRGHRGPMGTTTARTVFCFVARMDGITQQRIGDFLGVNHSTVACAEGRMRDALATPRFFPDLIRLYNEFTQQIL